MNDEVTLVIPGDPMGKERHRTSKKSGVEYTPCRTKAYESRVKAVYLQKYGNVKTFQQGEALEIRIYAFFGLNVSDTKTVKWKKLRNLLRPTKKPDWDNIGKIVSDALNGMAFHDDAQIVDGMVRKFYSEVPRVEIKITYAGGIKQ